MARPRRSPLVAVAIAGSLLASGSARAAGDPYLDWWTIETTHFRVHYYRGLEPVAERVALLAEGIRDDLAPDLGWAPHELTEIVVTDDTDDANGSATALPYNTIRLYVTAPDDMSPLGEYADWYLELVTHEQTHILHLDHTSGAPALANAIFGKIVAPNQAQPRWILEGLAVLEESRHTSGGRNRSSIFDTWLRADVLEDRMAGLDRVSNPVRRWPQGNLWYLYGSRFLTWITDVYGHAVVPNVADDYGQQIIPWGINRSIRRATGHTYEELYEGWKAYLRERYGRQVADAERRGLREGTRLTHRGQIAGRPRFVPPAARRDPAAEELLYYRDDGHTRGGFWRLPLAPGRAAAREDDARLAVRTDGAGSASFTPEGGVVFSSPATFRRIYSFDDLFALPPGVESPSAYEAERTQLTHGERAVDPDVSPDGTHVVFTENHRGTTTLMIADRAEDGRLSNRRALVPSARWEQAYTPRFSPDGRKVAYSAWTAGGFRDVRIVDVATGAFVEVAHDRAVDMQPSWSPDGAWLFFASDRALGIFNVLAYRVASGELRQVTNVKTGAFQPEASPDGRTLVYVGYSSSGYDLWSLPLDPAGWLDVPTYVDARPDPPRREQDRIVARHPYNPLPTLRPHAWLPDFNLGPGTFGTALLLSTTGADAVGHHAFSASMLFQTQRDDPQISLAYTYGRLPFDLRMSFSRSFSPRKYRYGGEDLPWVERDLSLSSSLSYALPTAYDSQSFSLAYTISEIGGELPLPANVDPYAPISSDPTRGFLGVARLGWGWSNAERYLWSVGAERGMSLSASAEVGDRSLASDWTLYAFSYGASGYVPMPWLRHHVLALHAGGAFASGDYPRRGVFYTGGFVGSPPVDLVSDFANGIGRGAFVLRGYAPVAFLGSQYHLANAEYRFPIVNVDRGPSTLPAFFNRLSGALFADYGGAFDDLDRERWREQFHLGVGGELWLEGTLGYFLPVFLRMGWAHGVSDPAAIPGGLTYLVLSSPY